MTSALTSYVTANSASATVTSAQLLWGNGPDADDCLSSGIIQTVTLSAASANNLWTAHCLRATASHTFNTYFIQILGISTFTVQATATGTAQPVTAMGGLMPMAVADTWTPTDDTPKSPWANDWSNENLNQKTCAAWHSVPVPHVMYPKSAQDGGCPNSPTDPRLNTDNYKGLLLMSGPPNSSSAAPVQNIGNSDTTGCRWVNHHAGVNGSSPNDQKNPPDTVQRGFNNPPNNGNNRHQGNNYVDAKGDGCCGGSGNYNFAGGVGTNWNNALFRSPPSPYNDCSSETNYQTNVIPYLVQYGYGGIVNSGNAANGAGDFFVLVGGNLGSNIASAFQIGPCLGVNVTTVFIPLFDAFADPNNNGNTQASVHISRFGALQITCPPATSSSISGKWVQGSVPSSLVGAMSGTREANKPNVTVLKLVQ